MLGAVVAFCLVTGVIGAYALTRNNDEPSTALPQSSQPFPSQASAAADEPTSSAAAPTPSGGPTYGSTKTVTDAGWTLTVNYLQCDIARLGTGSIAGTDAKGQFCVVNLTVRNGSNESARFFSSGQEAFDSAGTEYRSSLVGSTYANYKDHPEFTESINPGATATGFVAFDLSKGKKIAKLQLHAELFDTGVVVQVS